MFVNSNVRLRQKLIPGQQVWLKSRQRTGCESTHTWLVERVRGECVELPSGTVNNALSTHLCRLEEMISARSSGPCFECDRDATKRWLCGASEAVRRAISLYPDRSCCSLGKIKRRDSGKPAPNQRVRRKIDRCVSKEHTPS